MLAACVVVFNIATPPSDAAAHLYSLYQHWATAQASRYLIVSGTGNNSSIVFTAINKGVDGTIKGW